ncbi:uncharacterized protein METZ01_LOCUS225810, partial [marine metagenome]
MLPISLLAVKSSRYKINGHGTGGTVDFSNNDKQKVGENGS